jgi:uncharacterized membrane protein
MGRTYPMDIGKYLTESWKIISSDYLTWILTGLLVVAGGSIIPIILTAPLTVGFSSMFLKAARGERAQLGDIEEGFSRFFDAILAMIFVGIIVIIGFILLIIPGIIVLVWYMYTPVVMADKKCGFSEAMSESKRVAKKDFWGSLFLGITFVIINAIGGALVVVWILTIPLTYGALVLGYRELQASEK